jgi:hypothetical protein
MASCLCESKLTQTLYGQILFGVPVFYLQLKLMFDYMFALKVHFP